MSITKFIRIVFLLGAFVMLIGVFLPWFNLEEGADSEIIDLSINQASLILKKATLFFFAIGGIILFRNYLTFPGKKYPLFGLLIGLAATFLLYSVYVDSSYESLGLSNGLGFCFELVGTALILLSSVTLLIFQLNSKSNI